MAIVNASFIVIICNHYEGNIFFCETSQKKTSTLLGRHNEFRDYCSFENPFGNI